MGFGLQKIRHLIKQSDVLGVLVVSGTDLRYITGISLSSGVLFITLEKAILFIDPRFQLAVESLSQDFDIQCYRGRAEMHASLEKCLKSISGPIGFDASTMMVERFQELSSCGHPSQLIPAPAIFSSLRRPKTLEEIQAIEEACTLCEKGFLYLVDKIHEGITEVELEALLKGFWFTHGAESVSFDPIIAFGVHTACPHWVSSSTPLLPDSPILIDIGVKVHGYHSDMTRTLFFGRPDAELLACHALVQETYTLVVSHARPGVTPLSLDTIAREFLKSKGYGDSFIHGLGHGVGLEVHEPPRISPFAREEKELELGDVITIEPGIYLPGRGGIRLENTLVIEENSARSLMSVPL